MLPMSHCMPCAMLCHAMCHTRAAPKLRAECCMPCRATCTFSSQLTKGTIGPNRRHKGTNRLHKGPKIGGNGPNGPNTSNFGVRPRGPAFGKPILENRSQFWGSAEGSCLRQTNFEKLVPILGPLAFNLPRKNGVPRPRATHHRHRLTETVSLLQKSWGVLWICQSGAPKPSSGA